MINTCEAIHIDSNESSTLRPFETPQKLNKPPKEIENDFPKKQLFQENSSKAGNIGFRINFNQKSDEQFNLTSEEKSFANKECYLTEEENYFEDSENENDDDFFDCEFEISENCDEDINNQEEDEEIEVNRNLEEEFNQSNTTPTRDECSLILRISNEVLTENQVGNLFNPECMESMKIVNPITKDPSQSYYSIPMVFRLLILIVCLFVVFKMSSFSSLPNTPLLKASRMIKSFLL